MSETGKTQGATVDGKPSEAATPADRETDTAAVVFELVKQVAKDRPIDLVLDTPLVEMGLTSLERMEVLGLVEERYGGRFPEMVLMDLETCGEVVEAVETHLIGRGE